MDSEAWHLSKPWIPRFEIQNLNCVPRLPQQLGELGTSIDPGKSKKRLCWDYLVSEDRPGGSHSHAPGGEGRFAWRRAWSL
jgi:hypothetical protein